MTFTLQPVRIATGFQEEGMLVFAEGRLVAVLVRLGDDNQVAPGAWYHETGFGRFMDGPDHPIFPNLDDAQDWIAERLAMRAKSAGAAQS